MNKHILSKYEPRENRCSHLSTNKIQFNGKSIRREKEGQHILKRGKTKRQYNHQKHICT